MVLGNGSNNQTNELLNSITLSPRKYSIDPDDERNKYFDIKWYCRRLPDEQFFNLLPDERQNFSDPIYDRANIDEEWGDDDGGGCFGHGPGRINMSDVDEIDWNTTYFRKPDMSYEVRKAFCQVAIFNEHHFFSDCRSDYST